MLKNLSSNLSAFSVKPIIGQILNKLQISGRKYCRLSFLGLLIVFIQLSTSLLSNAQRGLEYPLNNRVIINYQDYVVYAEVKTEGIKPKPKDKYYYYWFNSNDIKKTRGGYDGKLLQGKYTEFYSNKNLKAKGKFKNGRKKGKWKYWYPNGQYNEVIKWRKKGRVGKFKLYDKEGNITKKGRYENDQQDGVVWEYVSGVPVKKKYRNGAEVIKVIKEKKVKKKKASGDSLNVKTEKRNIFKIFNRAKKDSLSVPPTSTRDNSPISPSANEKKAKKERDKKDNQEIDKKIKKDKKQVEPKPAVNSNNPPIPKEKKEKKKKVSNDKG